MKLSDMYTNKELMDDSEALGLYVLNEMSSEDLDKDFPVRTMTSEDLKRLEVYFGSGTVADSFKHASKDQRNLVKQNIESFDHERVVVVAGISLLDGCHHVIAAIKSGRSVKYIDLEEE